MAVERLTLTARGDIRYALKTPYRDGTTHVVFEPLDFLSRLAALVPSPRVNLTRFHGVFAPHHALRSRIVPGRGAGERAASQGEGGSRARSLGWAMRLKRVFALEVQRCERCGGRTKVISAIEDAEVIEKILRHVGLGGAQAGEPLPRAPPGRAGLFD